MSKRFRLFGRGQSGDTIVEVVIAIAVIAVVLTGAFVVTNRSLTAVRDSEEHSEALNLLQGQVEQLRNAADQAGGVATKYTITSPLTAFCFNGSNNLITYVAASCTQTLYTLKIEACATSMCPAPGGSSPTTPFLLTATWSSLSGGNDQVQLTYRVFVN